MLNRIAAVSVIALMSGAAAYAQTTPTTPTVPTTPSRPAVTQPAPFSTGADAGKLIGRNIRNLQNETIGEIKSVHIGPDGAVDQVIVSVGGFLGIGDREVAIAWKDLSIQDDGARVTVDMSKDQLKAMAEYRYSDPAWRGRVFSDRGPMERVPMDRADRPADRVPADRADRIPADRTAPGTTVPSTQPPAATTVPATPRASTAFNARGEMSGDAVIGATVRNQANESIGTISDVYFDDTGAVKTVIVSVGGFLGMGSHDVAMSWKDFTFKRDGTALVITTAMTKEALKALPSYKREQAQAPR